MPESLASLPQHAPRNALVTPSAHELLATLAQQLPAAVWLVDSNLRFTVSLGQALAELGLQTAEVVGRSLYEFFSTSDPAFPPVAAHRRALGGESQAYEWSWGDRVFDVILEPWLDASGAVRGVVGLAVERTEREPSECVPLAADLRYRSLFENAHDAVFILDLAGNFLDVNRAAERISGYKRCELIGMNISALLDPPAASYVNELIQRALGGETRAEFELAIRRRDGGLAYLDVSARLEFAGGKPAAIQGIARDITERKRLEEQLQEAQKMEAVGALASGVVHEFNNLLTAILGYADLLGSQTPGEDLVREAAEVIRHAADRGRQLASRLLRLARRGKALDVAVDLHALLEEISSLLRGVLRQNITLVERYDAPVAITRGDPGQLHQAVLNLALNARDAMPGTGVLTLETELVTLEPENFRDFGVPAPGRFIKLSVRYAGSSESPGRPLEFLDPVSGRSAEESDSTRLVTVEGIVRNQGGAVRVLSDRGLGCAFELYLPLLEAGAAAETGNPAQAVPGGAVLVIDDEILVGRTAVRLLQKLGYDAICLTDARQALEVLRQDPAAFGLVLLDLVMPGMNGPECLRELKSLRPGLPVLVTTGYAAEEALEKIQAEGATGFLAKPYTLEQLSEAVRRALGVWPTGAAP